MRPEIEQLIRDTIEVTGAEPPNLLNGQGPTLGDDALKARGFYLVGLIGGKEVGKSSLVNALVGQKITEATSYGPGTETVIAYAHESQASSLKAMLQQEVGGQFRIVTHRIAGLTRQVLLDLPDIDSHFESHVELTRKTLKHILFPLWVQSVEKYADRQPQQLLAAVAGGNAAGNFLFCLNKADQLKGSSGPAAIEELREDFARRIGKTLAMVPPKVWMLSAAEPSAFDLPGLRELLAREKSDSLVRESQSSARQQQERSILAWMDQQELNGRLQRLERLEEEAAQLLAARIASPLIEKSLPELAEDPASQLALTDEVLAARVAHWPMVNLVHLVLTPVLAVVRRNVGATRSSTLPDAEGLVEAHLRADGSSVAMLIRTSFALLQQSSPQVSELYQQRRLWEDMPADQAAVQLRMKLTETIQQQRQEVRNRLSGNATVIFAPLRWLLTIGALVWFPLLQPVLDDLVSRNELNWSIIHDTHELVVLSVRIFSVSELLQNLEFLAMYFFLLWVILRWHTQQRIARFMQRWKNESSTLSLTAVSIEWLDELLEPIKKAKRYIATLLEKRNQFAREGDHQT